MFDLRCSKNADDKMQLVSRHSTLNEAINAYIKYNDEIVRTYKTHDFYETAVFDMGDKEFKQECISNKALKQYNKVASMLW